MRKSNDKRKAWLFGLLTLFSCTPDASPDGSFASLEEAFRTPPDSIRPSAYWYWLSDNVSAEGVIRDLQAMQQVGIGRAFIGNIGLNPAETAYGEVKLFSPEWWKATREAIRKAGELGIDIGLFNSPGWSQSGGPWVKPEEAMRYLSISSLRVKGPERFSGALPQPAGPFEDLALLAYPAPEGQGESLSPARLHASAPVGNLPYLMDGDTTTEASWTAAAGLSLSIDIKASAPFTARSLVLYPARKPFRAEAELQVLENGAYRSLRKFEFNRSNPELHVGFIPYAPVSIAFPAVEADAFRLVLSNMQGSGGLAEVEISPAARLERYMEKQLAKMFQTPLPLWQEYQWETQPEVAEEDLLLLPSSVLNLSERLTAEGTLDWAVPEGEWILLRIGLRPTGVTNAPASPEGRGYEVDKMNAEALKAHFDAFVGRVLDSIPEAERKAFKWVVADSYETGSQNWTQGFAEDFKKTYGYDPLPWLPVLTGTIVGSPTESDRFLWDLRRLIADKVAYEYVGGLRQRSHEKGLKVWLENYGHWGFPGEFLQYGGQSDEVGGEFWNEGDLGSIELRAASSAAHIYGKTRVAAESFTAGGQAYARSPAMLKKRGDWSFTEGVNHTLLHVFVHQPYEERSPGVNAGFGTEFTRKNTWFGQSRMFVDYLRRCMLLLQQGRPVAELAYFIGEDAPKMTGIREPELPEGYNFDYINAEVILERLQVRNGKLYLPEGQRYDLLVLPPQKTMRPALLRKIRDLVTGGAAILGPRPEISPSLQGYPEADREVQELAAELWGGEERKASGWRDAGKGKVFWGMSAREALDLLAVQPDFQLEQPAPLLYTHRSLPGGELYFLSNQSGESVEVSPSFRVSGKRPEFWDPLSGTVQELPSFQMDKGSGRTTVPLRLEGFQSGFIVFRKAANGGGDAEPGRNFPATEDLLRLEGPWELQFDTVMRGPAKPVVLEELKDWTEFGDDAIKYYSGTVVYRTSFRADAAMLARERLFLDLGKVGVMATVKLNGKDAGGVWTAPWRVEIGGLVQEGENRLEIEVVNTWVNRLIGDSKLPPEQRKTWTNVNPYGPESPLQASGLVGPVVLQAYRETE